MFRSSGTDFEKRSLDIYSIFPNFDIYFIQKKIYLNAYDSLRN